MSAKAGRDILIKMKDEAGNFVSLAGLRTKSLKFNARGVDITDSESVQAWRELLPGAGVKTAEISGSGVFRDKPSDALARTAFFGQDVNEYQFIIPGFGTLSGPFLISALSYAGGYQGEASFEMTLLSAGAVQFTS